MERKRKTEEDRRVGGDMKERNQKGKIENDAQRWGVRKERKMGIERGTNTAGG